MFHKEIDGVIFVVGLVNLTIHPDFRCGYLSKVFESIKNECQPWVCFKHEKGHEKISKRSKPFIECWGCGSFLPKYPAVMVFFFSERLAHSFAITRKKKRMTRVVVLKFD